MIIVLDTNIVFSALLNPKSIFGDIILDINGEIDFYAPEFLIEEIDKYSEKIIRYSKLDLESLMTLKKIVLNSINFISEDLIAQSSWQKAYDLTKDVDEKDTPFIALAIDMNERLWTSDKKLINGIVKKNNNLIISTDQLLKSIE